MAAEHEGLLIARPNVARGVIVDVVRRVREVVLTAAVHSQVTESAASPECVRNVI